MAGHISVRRAIWVGMVVVNGPMACLLIIPLAVFAGLIDRGVVDRDLTWIGLRVLEVR